MAELIAVDTETVRRHAQRVGQIASDVRLAENAAGSMNVGGGAFGVMCAFLVPPAQLVSSIAIGTISAAATMLEQSEEQLKGLADDFDEGEQRQLDTISGLMASVEGGVR
ncbi:type VII secretion target [Microbacterium sp. LMC-P-041]|uniref:type VII secretion target n=1 Tax=Microbacterium sp. LMC-P-041 TaxID=3040293 RepID=UPI002555BA6E|nr:type VII secretion target [Microbacterium sp. LMC-P-041]